MPDKAILLYGGGLDSTSLLVWLNETRPHELDEDLEVSALHFQYRQKAAAGERRAVEYFCGKYGTVLKVVDVPIDQIANSAILKGQKKNTKNESNLNRLEARNVIFMSIAATWSATIGASKIFLGYHAEPEGVPFPDATIHTIDAMNAVLALSMEHRVRIEVPFANMTREEVLRTGYDLDEEIATKSFTCYESTTFKECGKCAHCLLKHEMLVRMLSTPIVRTHSPLRYTEDK